MIFASNNMKPLNIILVLTVVLFETKCTVGGKSDEKCNEYIQLSRLRRDDQSVKNLGKVEASAYEFPHMAALVYGETSDIRCGGSLISDQYVVTSAYCLVSRFAGPIKKVRLGNLNAASGADDAGVQEFTVVSTITHPDYIDSKVHNNIGLLKLDRPVNVTKSVRPACLQVEEQIGSDTAVATGWGSLSESSIGNRADRLMKVELDLYTNEECSGYYKDKLSVEITSNMICSGGKGDGGGPLQVLRDGQPRVYNIIGVILFGAGCGKVNTPEVATRISSYVPWLESIVWP